MISEIFSYSFLVRALLVGLFVSISASLLGVSLVLRRFSMIGDGLSHVGFGALGISALLSLQPMAVTIPVVVAAAFIQHVPQHLAQLMHGILRPLRADANKGIYVVERVEQEMRVQLILQVLQFNLFPLGNHLLLVPLPLEPPLAKLQCNAHAQRQHHHHKVARHKPLQSPQNPLLSRKLGVRRHFPLAWHISPGRETQVVRLKDNE